MPDFVKELTLAAASAHVTRAALLRTVLPFDENTSSNDQSKIFSHSSSNSNNNNDNNNNNLLLEKLREQAVAIRKIVRVKLADEADLQQAIAACAMVRSFIVKVEQLVSATSAASSGGPSNNNTDSLLLLTSPVSVIRILEEKSR